MLFYAEYERLTARDRRIVRLEDWSEEEIRALEGMAMAPGHEDLDAELER